jgi:hypothetical protein
MTAYNVSADASGGTRAYKRDGVQRDPRGNAVSGAAYRE